MNPSLGFEEHVGMEHYYGIHLLFRHWRLIPAIILPSRPPSDGGEAD